MVARSVGCITTALALSLLAQQAPPTIRSRTTLVPVDVRVVDLNGNPVTDLKKEDFTVEEDGVRQDIRLFEAHALTAETPAPGGPALHHELAADATTGVQTQRIFLFVFGRGRLQAPGKAIDAAIDFVRGRLLPQDRVAVLAYNRATDFTTDRAAIVTTLERFRKGHERVEADMAQYFSGLRAVYGSRELPGHIQRQVDEIFNGPGAASARRLPPGTSTDARQQADDVRRGAEALQRAEILATRLPGSGVDTTFDLANADLVGGSFDEFANATLEAGQGLSSIYTAITYLRHLNGEKHIIFMKERGLFLPRAENDGSVAALASDARVVIDTIQTGGVLSMNPLGRPCPVCPTQVMPDRLARMSNNQVFAEQAVRNIAGLTGGLSSITGPPAKLLARIDRSSRFQYLLGYAPVSATYDGRFRRIRVKVNRRGVQVLHRNGYYARRELVPVDRRDFYTTTRIAAAGVYVGEISDLKVSATATFEKGASEVAADVTLKPDRISFEHGGGRHKASVQMAFFLGDGNEDIVGERWQLVDMNLTDASYQEFKMRGASFSLPIAVAGEPRLLKVIAYDYAADLIGIANVSVRVK
jgi:hypothetical protein